MNIWQHPNMQYETIERRSLVPYHEFFKSYTKNSRPVVMTDAIADWPAIRKWNLDYFKVQVGNHPVRGTSRTLAECIDVMLASTSEAPGPYIPSLRFDEDMPSLYEDILPRPVCWAPDWLGSPWVMPGLPLHPLHLVSGIEVNLSGPYSTFPEGLHYDDLMAQTFIAQVHGTKQVILISPEQSKFIYPEVINPAMCTYSRSPIPVTRDFDIDEFPLAAQLIPISFELGPGDMLCTPPGWWHCVRANEPSIAVVTSIANKVAWPKVRREVVRASMNMHKPWKAPIAAAYYAAYMTVYGLARIVSDKLRK